MMLECMIALVIFAIGVLGMVKMQSLSTSNSVNSEDRATAATLANDLVAELWATHSTAAPADYATTGGWQDTVTKSLPNGDGQLTSPAAGVALVTIRWDAKGGTTDGASSPRASYVTQVTIQ